MYPKSLATATCSSYSTPRKDKKVNYISFFFSFFFFRVYYMYIYVICIYIYMYIPSSRGNRVVSWNQCCPGWVSRNEWRQMLSASKPTNRPQQSAGQLKKSLTVTCLCTDKKRCGDSHSIKLLILEIGLLKIEINDTLVPLFSYSLCGALVLGCVAGRWWTCEKTSSKGKRSTRTLTQPGAKTCSCD